MVALSAHYEVKRVNDDTHYKSPEGYHTNHGGMPFLALAPY